MGDVPFGLLAYHLLSEIVVCEKAAVVVRYTNDYLYCFVWSSYSYMEHIVSKWDEMGVLKRVLEKKLIFIETKVKCMIKFGGFHGIFFMRGCYVLHPSLFLSLLINWTIGGEFDKECW